MKSQLDKELNKKVNRVDAEQKGFSQYDPHYDPNHSKIPGLNSDYAPTYWVDSAGIPPEDDGPVKGDIEVDVAIIGSGYTGLSCAIHLSKEYGIKAHVLEANKLAWGCSTRNGGQAQNSTGRLKRSQWIKRWGFDVAEKMHAEVANAFEFFNSLIKDHNIECEPQTGGHYYIAHKPSVISRLEQECNLLNEKFNYPARMLTRDELHEMAVKDQEAAGAMIEPDGTSIHASKLAFGYMRIARQYGAKIHTASPVTGWETSGNKHRLKTPNGIVTASSVAIATAAYTAPGLSPYTRNRLMPVLSNSIVTRPLTASELDECGFKTKSPLTDTRTLRHYYRLLPDNRVQIGTRSAITGKDAANAKHLRLLEQGLYRKFPSLTDIKLDYSWWGWVDVSHDDMPRIFQPDPKQKIYYALGYGGNGVMYSAQAGRRMAEMVAGKSEHLTLPIFQSPLPHYGLLTPFRRLGQRCLYIWYQYQDERK